ncbi:hypothetical protein [Gaoshiqia sp. Z1-71]|uniref:hypothetical protein n=1 Tax=Gaoshiqia hydrogeniformans TaxID=3290090 RepID=UPI003BF888D3
MKQIAFILIICTTINMNSLGQHKNVSWDLFQYSGPGLTQIGWLDTKHAREIQSSTWSVGCETLDRDYAKFSVYKNYVGELGVKHARLQSGWAKCEKEKGKYNFEWLDSCVYGLTEQSVQPWMCLCYGNPVYGSDFNLQAKIFTDEKTMNAWLKYVEATVKRYKDVIKEWEIWNEANNGNKDPEVYASLFIKTAEVVRKVQPDAVIIGLSTYRIPLDYIKEFLDILKTNKKLNLLDYVCYHPYLNNPDDSYEDVDKLSALVNSYSPDIKLYQGENGCPSILEWGHALKYHTWTEISQAKWFVRRMAGDRVRDIRTNVFTLIDLKYTNMLQSFGLIRSNLLHEIIYKRPSYYGVQHMVSFFDDSVKSVGELKYNSTADQKITVAGFRKEGSPIVLLWHKDRIPGDEFKWDLTNITIEGVNFDDPVYVEMISGKVYEIGKTDRENKGKDVVLKNLPVWDSVMMIAERSQVNLKTE